MRTSFRELIVKTRVRGVRLMKDLAQRIDPGEREFRRVWPMIDGIEGLLISPIQERWLFKTARALPDRSVIVEIGSFKGRSTCCLAYGCRGTTKNVYAIDTFSGNDGDCRPGQVLYGGRKDGICTPLSHSGDFFDDFLSNIKKCGLTAYVTPLRQQSSEIGKAWDKPIHLLFIDGSHEYEDVLADFENFSPHVVSGGIVAFHDVHFRSDTPIGFPGVHRVWEERASMVLAETGRCSTIAFGKKR